MLSAAIFLTLVYRSPTMPLLAVDIEPFCGLALGKFPLLGNSPCVVENTVRIPGSSTILRLDCSPFFT